MKENVIQITSRIKCRRECKKYHICEKDYIRNPATCSCENGKYLASVIDDSNIMWDEVIDAEDNCFCKTNFTKQFTINFTANFNEKK